MLFIARDASKISKQVVCYENIGDMLRNPTNSCMSQNRAWSSCLSVTGIAESGKRSAQRTCCKFGRKLRLTMKRYSDFKDLQNSKEAFCDKSFHFKVIDPQACRRVWLEGVALVCVLGLSKEVGR